MAKTFNYGAGIWATKTGSSMAYNDQNDNYKPLPFSVTRDSIATRVNKQGLIEVVGKDKLRIDYTDSSKGVALLEPARTNLISYSEDFSQSAWVKTRVSISSNVAISPDGSQNADKLVESTASGTHFLRIEVTSGSPALLSVFAKKGEETSFAIGNATGSQGVDFDLENGIVSGTGGFIEDYGNGWYRCSYYRASWSDWQYFKLRSNTASYTGDGTSGIYIWGAQFEAGSYATSYIPTSGSTYQRQSDVANGAGNSEVFNDSEGVLFADIAALANDGTNRVISISDGSLNNRVFIKYSSTNNQIEGTIVSGNIAQAAMTETLTNALLFSKICVKYKANDFSLWVNGFEVNTDTSGSAPTGLSDISFDTSGLNDFYGKTKRISVYDAVLTDAELEALKRIKFNN
jgi:hypothetical protein